MQDIRILCLSGSLRKASYNTALIKALPKLAPVETRVEVFSGLGELPLFNPDREQEHIPAVSELISAVGLAHGLVIASPEYAHGISGVMKNALDWLVSTEVFPDMPVALLNASPRASHAQAALREVIKTMSGNIIEPASISIPLLGSNLDTDGILKHKEISHSLQTALAIFHREIISHRDNSSE